MVKVSNQSKIDYYLGKIMDVASSNRCVFRGQADASWALQSGAERRIRKAVSDEKLLNENAIKQSLKIYHNNILDNARQKGFGFMDGRRLDDFEVLAKLQHFGADTALIDFTWRAVVALYFACGTTSPNSNGRVYISFAGPISRVSKIEQDNEFSALIEMGDLRFWEPVIHGDAERRIIAQSGLFLINVNHNVVLPSIEVDHSDKEEILADLRNKHHVSAETLFMDLGGFAQHWSDKESLEIYFYRGLTHQNQGEYPEAVDYYSDVLRIDPNYIYAHINLGIISNALMDYEGAIKHYNKANQIDPNNFSVYILRGNTKFAQRKFEDAVSDFNLGIQANPNNSEAFDLRGRTLFELGRSEEAVNDYIEALRLNPNNASAAYNLTIARLALSNSENQIRSE